MAKRPACVATAALKGQPQDAVEHVEVDAMVFDPEDERAIVKLKMAYAAVHPADCNVLEGTYMYKVASYPSGPIGYEGSGIVAALSKGALARGDLKEGDLVIPKIGSPEGFPVYEGRTGGAWTTEIVAPSEGLLRVPGTWGLSAQQAALVGVNPASAYCLLKHGGVSLEPGSWVLQNLGNSALGLAVCSQAKRLGFKTCSIVRREEAAKDVKDAGGDVVVVANHERVDRSQPADVVQQEVDKQIAACAETIKTAMKEADPNAKFGLAFDGVGGASAGSLLKCLSPGGTMLVYGNMSREPIQVGGGQLIFKQIHVAGFVLWNLLPGAKKALSAEAIEEMNTFLLATAAEVSTPVAAVYPLAQVKEAVKHAFTEKRVGKVLLKCNEDVD